MPRALGARVLRRGAGPGPSPLILSRVSAACGARRGLRLAGGGGVGGVACCRVLGRCALVSGPLGPLLLGWGRGLWAGWL